MDLNHLCAGIRERVALELQQENDPAARDELLIAALYDLSRVVLPQLGSPRTSLEYRQGKEAVLELISCIAIPLVRGGGERGVAVLSELAEGCQDPLLKKKLSVYAQELLAKSRPAARQGTHPGARRAAMLVAAGVLPLLLLYLAWPMAGQRPGTPPAPAFAPESAPAQAPASAAPPAPPVAPPAGPPAERARLAEQCPPLPPKAEKAASVVAPPVHGEQVTRVRIVNDQVLVPVVLKHGGGTLRLELVLDTGATRTALHESVTTRLPIDLRSARTALAELADGRMIRSKVARIDQLSVGPFAHAAMELELIPFSGAEGTHDGLLGMDFLGRHRYQIDMEHELIRWF